MEIEMRELGNEKWAVGGRYQEIGSITLYTDAHAFFFLEK